MADEPLYTDEQLRRARERVARERAAMQQHEGIQPGQVPVPPQPAAPQHSGRPTPQPAAPRHSGQPTPPPPPPTRQIQQQAINTVRARHQAQAATSHTPPVQQQHLPPTEPVDLHKDRSHMKAAPAKTRKRRRGFDFIAFIGELLVTAGVLLGMFAFWQVFVTDWQVEKDKVSALKDFNSTVDCVQKVSTDIRTDTPPVPDKPVLNQTFGALHIPSWNYMVLPLKEGTTPQQLDLAAAGHYIDTQLPGEKGNFAVAAHRRSRGSSFRHIDDLRNGDKVIVETKDTWYVYRMYSHEIVAPSQGSVIWAVPNESGATPEKYLMTMTSCHPEYGNSERYVVHLELEYWTPHSAGIPKELAEGGYKCT